MYKLSEKEIASCFNNTFSLLTRMENKYPQVKVLTTKHQSDISDFKKVVHLDTLCGLAIIKEEITQEYINIINSVYESGTYNWAKLKEIKIPADEDGIFNTLLSTFELIEESEKIELYIVVLRLLKLIED